MNTTLLSSLSFEEQGAILFSSALLCVSTVVFFALSVWRVSLGKSVFACNCCCVTLMRVIWRRCCACRDLDRRLREHLKSDGEEEEMN